jgi:hypothetical protein
MSSVIAEVGILENRVEVLEQREESTRRRFEQHLSDDAGERKAMAAALESIRFDVHAIREGKKSIMRMGRAFLLIAGLTGTGVVLAGKWTLEHALADWQTQHDPAQHKEIP